MAIPISSNPAAKFKSAGLPVHIIADPLTSNDFIFYKKTLYDIISSEGLNACFIQVSMEKSGLHLEIMNRHGNFLDFD